MTAHFRDAIGLRVGNDVSILGIRVGSVKQIKATGSSVEVLLTIDAGTELPADVNAVTLSPSVVTDRRVEMTPAYTGGPKLADGDVIPLDRTRTPVEIDRVFRAANDLAIALREQAGNAPLADLVDAGADFLGGEGATARATLRKLANATDVGVENRDELVGLIRNVDLLTQSAVANDKLIRSFSGNVTEATELFAEEGPQIATSLESLVSLLDQIDAFVTENRQSIRHTIANLKTTVGTFSGRTREISDTANILPLIFQNAARVTDPRTGVARGHGLLDETVLHTEVIKALCPTLPTLPMCRGGAGPLTPDGGIFEMLLGIVRGSK